MRGFKSLAMAAVAVGCGGTMQPGSMDQTTDALPDVPSHVQFVKNEAHHHGGNGNLVDHGGPVLAADTTYAIWWGNAASFPSDAQSGIDALFRGFNGTPFLSVANQYMHGATATASFSGNWSDGSAPPNGAPSTSAIVNEACKVIAANGAKPNSSAIYFVFTSNFPGNVNYCAWHSAGTCNGTPIQVAYMPNVAGVAGCDPGNLYGCNSYSQGTRALANVTSHEYMEAITDPQLDAWYDGSGAEIGDKCAWQFSSCVNLSGGNWQLQKEWSNANNGCVQQ